MRITSFLIIGLLAGVSPANAGELVSEPHALLYYQFAFSGDAPDRQSRFGLRLDRTFRESDQVLEFRDIIVRPAVAELRFNSAGMESLTLAGVDYLAQYRMLNAAEGEPAEGETAAGGEAAAGEGAGKPAEKPAAKPAEKKPEEKEKLTMDKVMHSIPPGFFIGAGIAALLLGTSAAD
jgi:hypothetical protein